DSLWTAESIEFSRDNAFLAASSGHIWDLATGRETTRLPMGAVGGVAFHPKEPRVFFGSKDGTLRSADARTGKVEPSSPGHWAGVVSLCFSRDGSRLASSGADATRVWDARTGSEIAVFKVPDREA